jgi:hypothetical protein
LRGAVVLGQGHAPGRRRELVREVEDVAHRGGAEPVDGLGVVADHGQPAAVGLEPAQDVRLQHVGVLVFVHQDVIEARAHLGGQRGLGHQVVPVQEQVVVVEHPARLLGLDVGAEQRPQVRAPLLAPGKRPCQALVDRDLRVDHARVDAQARGLLGKAARLLGQPLLVAHQVHQVCGVRAVENREGRVEPDGRRVQSQQPVADGVERAGPVHGVAREHAAAAAGAPPRARHGLARGPDDALGAPAHLHRGPARERQQENATRIRAANHQMRHAVGQRVGLARAGPGNDQQRLHALVRHGLALGGIERGQIGRSLGQTMVISDLHGCTEGSAAPDCLSRYPMRRGHSQGCRARSAPGVLGHYRRLRRATTSASWRPSSFQPSR